MDLEDRALLASYREGSKEAFNQIMNKYYEVTLTCAHRIIRDTNLCEDVAQEVFMHAMRIFKRGGFNLQKSLAGFLARLAYKSAIDTYRTYYLSRKSSSFPKDSERIWRQFSIKQDKFETQKERFKELATDILLQLNENHAKILKMRFIEDMTFAEMSKELGITQSSIHKKVTEAFSRLEHLRESTDLFKDCRWAVRPLTAKEHQQYMKKHYNLTQQKRLEASLDA